MTATLVSSPSFIKVNPDLNNALVANINEVVEVPFSAAGIDPLLVPVLFENTLFPYFYNFDLYDAQRAPTCVAIGLICDCLNWVDLYQTLVRSKIFFRKELCFYCASRLHNTHFRPSQSRTQFGAVGTANVIAVAPVVPDPLNVDNYGAHVVTVLPLDGRSPLVQSQVKVTPPKHIQMPRKIIVKDSVNNTIPGAQVNISERNGGRTVAEGSTNNSGVYVPPTLPDGSYKIGISGPNLHPYSFDAVAFQDYRSSGDTPHFVSHKITGDNAEIVLRWAEMPQDLDSHLFTSDGRHVWFNSAEQKNMCLDYDVREGKGPETISIKPLERGIKYVYAVHRYTKDAPLTASRANVTMRSGGTNSREWNVPNQNQPNADFWVVFCIDGTTKTVTNINHLLDNVDFRSDSAMNAYF